MASALNPMSKTPAEWREMAAACHRRSQESWDRSDTDGFLSQWASDVTASQYALCASVAEQDGEIDVTVLTDTAGNHVPAKCLSTRYGMAWALIDPSNPGGGFAGFVNESSAATSEKRKAALAKKGYSLGTVPARALVVMTGGSMTSVRPTVVPADSKLTVIKQAAVKPAPVEAY